MKTKVLVIDDDSGIRESLKDVLSLENYDCTVADSGEKGLAMVQQNHPELVVMDIQLPDMSGYQVCQTMKRDPASRGVPVIMMTGRFTEPEDRVQGFEMGADEFFCKPFDPRYFIARVKSILKSVPPPPLS